MSDDDEPLLGLGDIITKLPEMRAARRVKSSRVHRRLLEVIEQDDDKLAFQHTVFCQTGLPYRNPGDAVRLWQRRQGAALLEVQAGRVAHPAVRDMVDVGLPWGTKPRLILAHLNAEALRQSSPEIEVESSLSAFVRRIRGFQHGREIQVFKDQLTRLAAASIRLTLFHSERMAEQVETKVITKFDLWLGKDERQRVLWPSTIHLSLDYFISLQRHAVPLNESDLAALAHSALALDLYAWLAQRLHRIDPLRPVFIQWPALKAQFGSDFVRLIDFKRKFRTALGQVLARYQRARVGVEEGGLRLHASLPPVGKLLG